MRGIVFVCVMGMLGGCGKSKASNPAEEAITKRSGACTSAQQRIWNTCAAALTLKGEETGIGAVSISGPCNSAALKTTSGANIPADKIGAHLADGGLVIRGVFTAKEGRMVWTCYATHGVMKRLRAYASIRKLRKGEL